MGAAYRAYLAWNVEIFLLLSIFYVSLFSPTTPLPCYFLIGETSLHSCEFQFARWLWEGADRLAFYNFCPKGSLPKDIIKSNEGASLTIC